ncbi:hypothetical protein Hanom_Chr11g01011421 [Helianthus anomalus]
MMSSAGLKPSVVASLPLPCHTTLHHPRHHLSQQLSALFRKKKNDKFDDYCIDLYRSARKKRFG